MFPALIFKFGCKKNGSGRNIHRRFSFFNHVLRYTVLPSTMVSCTAISFTSNVSPENGSDSKTTKSASLPTSIDPFVSSSKFCQAASIVIARNASSRSMRCASPMHCPLRERRFTADQTEKSDLVGVTGESLWMVKRIPRLDADFNGLIRCARSGPKKIASWRSPQ